jgi:hypothetical protein
MNSTIDFRKELHDKKINLLIGSGASFGALPTLKMNIDKNGEKLSFEDLACCLEDENKKTHSYLLFCEHYFKKLIAPSYDMDFKSDPNVISVCKNYKKLLEYIINLINLKKVDDYKKCNIFSTNYDGFIESATDQLIQAKKNFILNDGGFGFKERMLNASNFSMQVNHMGVFDSYISEIPIINLIKLHGSIYWGKRDDKIFIDYRNESPSILPSLKENYLDGITEYDVIKGLNIDLDDEDKLKDFWNEYKRIPIVNPTKWKFNETVFEQHYYQMLRLLSYELEKKDVFLIVFGFSFKDEHIYDLVKRSLLNPKLSVFIFCFDKIDFDEMNEKFADYNNVFFIIKHEKNDKSKIEPLDFSVFLDILNGKQDTETWKVLE